MEVILDNVGKRFRFDWIFKKISFHFKSGYSYALTGPNGAGKSTFLKIISGHLSPTKGKVNFHHNGKPLDIDSVYKHVAYAAPYIELIEELTLKEAMVFHLQFKNLVQGLDQKDLIEILGFENALDKEIRYFSSGMKQRLKLVLAICSDCNILLLDEPTTNLDQQGADWYKQLIRQFKQNRLLVVASNVAEDFDFCDETVNILDYK